MEGIILTRHPRVHFIGICGISMSGLAMTLRRRGHIVTGSDITGSDMVEELASCGISISIHHAASNLPQHTDLVVYTSAVRMDNPELAQAAALGIPAIERAELVGLLMSEYRRPICISGTHGKTTTTAMISQILISAGLDPTINVGGILPSIRSNYLVGSGPHFVAEACEYHDSFLHFRPHIGVILNIETDHLDYFRDLHHIEQSFANFASNIIPGGALIANEAMPSFEYIAGHFGNVVGYGLPSSRFSSRSHDFSRSGMASFELVVDGQPQGIVHTKLYGEHNISNSLAAIAACHTDGLSIADCIRGIETFAGTKRRFERKGRLLGGTLLVDDYAHHPTEIEATLQAARKAAGGRVIVVFQPHTFTRTRLLMDDLAKSFSDADAIGIVDIYPAREQDTGDVHSRDLVHAITSTGKEATYLPTPESVTDFVKQKCIHNDLLITMGAGDVYKYTEALLPTPLAI